MSSVSVTVGGLADVAAALRDVATKASAGAAQAVADEASSVVDDMQSAAPVDTGELRGSIEARQIGPQAWVVETGAYYAPWIEWGRKSASAQPFATPAAERSRARFPSGAARTMKAAVDG